MPLEQVVAEALAFVPAIAPAPPPASEAPAQSLGLTPRELDVLRLLVEGHSDRAIGESLFISHRTVMTHVTNILNKLGVDSRTAAAAHAVRLGLV
jgi:DNA-binding NarL/FixJ family response regulator